MTTEPPLNEDQLLILQKPKRRRGLYAMMFITTFASVGSCSYQMAEYAALKQALNGEEYQETTRPTYTSSQCEGKQKL